MGTCHSLECGAISPCKVTFDPPGRLLAIGGAGAVWVHDAQTGARRAALKIDDRPDSRVEALAFSPDSRQLWIATAIDDGPARIHVAALAEGTASRIEVPLLDRVAALGLTADGARVIVVTSDDVVLLEARGRGATRIPLPRHHEAAPARAGTTAIVPSSGALSMLIAADHVFDLDVEAGTAEVIAALEPEADDEEPFGLGLGSLAADAGDGAVWVAERSIDGLRGGRLFRVDDRGVEAHLGLEGNIYWMSPSGERLRYLDLRGCAHEVEIASGACAPLASPWLSRFEGHHGLWAVAASADGARLVLTTIDAPYERLVLVDERPSASNLN